MTRVRMCPVNPLRRHKLIPAKKASLAMGSTVTAAGSSLGPTTASHRPGPVATAAGEGGNAAADGAKETTGRTCLVDPPGLPQPVIPAKTASLAMPSFDGGEELAGSNDGLPQGRSSGDG